MGLPVSVLYLCDLRQGTVLLHTEHLGFLALNKGLTNQFAIQTDATAAIGEPEQAHKAHNMAASNNKDHTHDQQQATIKITPMITCSHHLYMGAILGPHPICGESCIQRHAKNLKWRQNHSLQNFCTNLIFAGEGSIKADDVSFAAIIYITLVYRRLRRNNDYSTYHYQHGRQIKFSMEWPKKLFDGANSGEI